MLGGLGAVEPGHGNIHDDYIRRQPLRHFARGHAVFGFPNDLNVSGGFQQHTDSLADQVVIVGHYNTDH